MQQTSRGNSSVSRNGKMKANKTIPTSQRACGLGQRFSNILVSGPIKLSKTIQEPKRASVYVVYICQ